MADERRTGGQPGNPLMMGLIFGILLGVVISSVTGQWWWIAVGVALGAAVSGGRAAALRRGRGPGPESKNPHPDRG
ncbi:hypothetical protein E4J89_11940 [Arthrobacter sp. CAU 1506]|uniref:hypothetical protein n=1 Tax=Arthrobacter sp. CAU 1506 TaxID=2560052 RepID=UPI0010AD8D58|nr:hypothetical protein [Arthrobacter sp. CAU 1506]TJY69261.1 hypothetical protein E4J89_11940 [Arthrobacter sp. CAU 1506]